jgi:polysaccharide biosynthesis transport protein
VLKGLERSMVDGLPRDDVQGHIVKDAARHHWRLIALVVIVLGAAAGAYLFSRPPTYSSTVTVLLRPIIGNALMPTAQNSSQSTTVAMQTEANLVTSQAVTARVISTLGPSRPLGNAQVTAVAPANSQIVRITCTASQPDRAQRCAQAYATEFLEYRATTATASQAGQIGKLNAQAAAVRKQLAEASALAAKPKPPADAVTTRNLYASNLASVLSQIGQVQSMTTVPGNVIRPAAAPERPNGMKPALLVGGITLVALVAGLGVAIWRERLDDRIRVSAEPEILGVPVVAMVPEGAPQARYVESMRRARTSLLAAAPANSVIAIAGLSATEHSSTIAADIARTMALAGYRVAFLDLALDDTAAHPLTASGKFGVSDALLSGRIDDLPASKIDDVDVIPIGSSPTAIRERYSGQAMRDLINRWRESHDFVILSTPPATSSDAMAVMLAMDGVVLIATDRHATHSQIAATNDALSRLNVRLIGIIVRRGARKWHAPAAAQPAPQPPAERKVPTPAPVARPRREHPSPAMEPTARFVPESNENASNGPVHARSSRERRRNQMMIAATRQHEERN